MDGAIILRVLLGITIAAMAVLALVYLYQRDLPLRDKIGWALVALLIPLFGPFLVILNRPGRFVRQRAGQASMRPTRLRIFAVLGPRRRRFIRPLASSSIQKKDNSI